MSSQLKRRAVIEDVQFLIENGADPTAVSEDEDTALHIAAHRDNVPILEVGHRYRPSFSDRMAVCVQSFFSITALRWTNSMQRRNLLCSWQYMRSPRPR